MNKVIIKNGKYAGKKAIIINKSDNMVTVRTTNEESKIITLSEEDIEPI